MHMPMSHRIVLTQAENARAVQAAVRWTARVPGVIAVGFQRETGELLVSYDLHRTTLACIRHHLYRGGVIGNISLMERFCLLAIARAETAWRRRTPRPLMARTPALPLVPLQDAA